VKKYKDAFRFIKNPTDKVKNLHLALWVL